MQHFNLTLLSHSPGLLLPLQNARHPGRYRNMCLMTPAEMLPQLVKMPSVLKSLSAGARLVFQQES